MIDLTYAGRDPNEREMLALNESLERNRGVLQRIYVMDNHRLRNVGDDLVRGTTLVLDPDAPLSKHNRMFTPKWFEMVSITRCAGTPSLQADLSMPDGLPLPFVEEAPDAEPQLGPWSHFAGLYREEAKNRLPDHYLCVRTGGGKAAFELDIWIDNNLPGLTCRRIVDSDQYRRAADYALRNHKRVVLALAQRLGVEINTEVDCMAQDPQPATAKPDHLVVSNVLEMGIASDARYQDHNREAAFYYAGTIALNSCMRHGRAVPTLIDPRQGLEVYIAGPGGWSNEAGSSFPLGTAPLSQEDAARLRSDLEKDPSQLDYANGIITWKKKRPSDLPTLNPRVYLYSEITPEARRARQLLGAGRFPVAHLVPVRVLLPSSPPTV